MAVYDTTKLRKILATETDSVTSNTELLEVLEQLRENYEALEARFLRAEAGTLTSDPPNDTTGVLTDTAGGFTTDEHNGHVVMISSGLAEGTIYTIDDTTTTTLVCTDDNPYLDGVRSGDSYEVYYNLWNIAAHDHDGLNSANVTLAEGSLALDRIVDFSSGNYCFTGGFHGSSTTSTSYTTVFRMIATRSGTIVFRVALKSAHATATAYYQVYLESVANGSEVSTASTTYQYANSTITVEAGDEITIQAKTSNASYAATVYAAGLCANPVDGGIHYSYLQEPP